MECSWQGAAERSRQDLCRLRNSPQKDKGRHWLPNTTEVLRGGVHPAVTSEDTGRDALHWHRDLREP